MIGNGLREELMGLAGVSTADFVANGPSSAAEVRVRLEPDADARAVGVEVQRILASHGLRSHLAEAGTTPEPPIPEPPPAADPAIEPVPAGSAGLPGLESIAVEETRDGVTVTATTADGRRFTEHAEASEDAIARAVAAVVGVLVDGRPARLLSISTTQGEGTTIVTVLIERAGGARAAGAAIVRAGMPYAVARAVWSCLR